MRTDRNPFVSSQKAQVEETPKSKNGPATMPKSRIDENLLSCSRQPDSKKWPTVCELLHVHQQEGPF